MTETNIFAHVYNSLLAYIPTKVAAIRFIAQDFGQLEVGERPAVSWPCLLIDFENASYSDESGNVQLGEAVMLLRLCTNPYQDDSNITPETSRTLAMKYYDLEAQLHTALQGWSDDYFGYVTRLSVVTEKREDALRVRQIRYSFAFKDDSAYNQLTVPKPDIVISVERDEPQVIPSTDYVAINTAGAVPLKNLLGSSCHDIFAEGQLSQDAGFVANLSSLNLTFWGFPAGAITNAVNYQAEGDGWNFDEQQMLDRGQDINTIFNGQGVIVFGYDFFDEFCATCQAAPIPITKITVGINLVRLLAQFSGVQKDWSQVDVSIVTTQLSYIVTRAAEFGIQVIGWEFAMEWTTPNYVDIVTNPGGDEQGGEVLVKLLTLTNSFSAINILDHALAVAPTAWRSIDVNLWDAFPGLYPTWIEEICSSLTDVVIRQYFQFYDQYCDTYEHARERVAMLASFFAFINGDQFNGLKVFLSQIEMKALNPLRNTVGNGLILAELYITASKLSRQYNDKLVGISQFNTRELVQVHNDFEPHTPFYFIKQLGELFDDNAEMVSVTFSDIGAQSNLVTLALKVGDEFRIGVLNPSDNDYTQEDFIINEQKFTDYTNHQNYAVGGDPMQDEFTEVNEAGVMLFRKKSFSVLKRLPD